VASSADRLDNMSNRLLASGFDIKQAPGATAVHGPARLPLSAPNQSSSSRAVLWYAEYGRERFAVAVVGDPRTHERTTVRIESACLFGHVFGSEQCDCGWQWRSSLETVLKVGGVLVYAIDQDARGLGVAAHFDIYQLRQEELLDTEAVFDRLNASWDNRDYGPVLELLRAVGVQRVRLLSNNRERLEVLAAGGFDVERSPAEADLNVSNMSTLMLEKEDLGYQWSFMTHADLLAPLQSRVGPPPATIGALARAGGPLTAEVSATWETVGAAVVTAAATEPTDNLVLYLTDLPRLEDLAGYAEIGVKVLVVPYPTLPPLLVKATDAVGIRLVDWSRRNRWAHPRPQWVPVAEDIDAAPRYVRLETDLHLPPPADAERLGSAGGTSA
jgi:GTP cyclohydrolase II